jgi:hypothetical protein
LAEPDRLVVDFLPVDFFAALFFVPAADAFFVGSFFLFVFASFSSCFALIDFAICFEAPRSDPLDFLPRLADRAAPAAICCFLDLAGIRDIYRK